MKRILLAGLAAGALIAAAPALAQPQPTPSSPPPIEQPQTEPEITPDEQVGTGVQQSAPLPAAPPAGEAATTAQAPADTQVAQPAQPADTQVAQPTLPTDPMTDTQVAEPTQPTDPNATPTQTAEQPSDAQPVQQADAAADTGSPVPASAQAVCAPRVTSVHFGRGSALSRQNQNAIEYAVDAASVCNLEQVTIADSSDGRTSDRRAEAVRATLIKQGVPENRIIVEEEATTEGAATGQLDVRMQFAGVATGGTPVASLETPAPQTPLAQPSTETPPVEPPAEQPSGD